MSDREERENARFFENLRTALSPLRVEMLTQLTLAAASAKELAHQLGIPEEKVRYQLQRLTKAGFVEVVEERRRRGTMERVYIAATPEMIYRGGSRLTEAQRKSFDAQVVKALFRDAVEATKAGNFKFGGGQLMARIPLEMDRQAMTEITRVFDEALDRMLVLQEESRSRLDESGAEAIAATSGLLFFELDE